MPTGFTRVHFDYKLGTHVSVNGRRLSAMLEKLVADWPVPVEEVSIVAHSMAGSSRGARATTPARPLAEKLARSLFPRNSHHGAPLERVGNWLETLLGVTRYSAPDRGPRPLTEARGSRSSFWQRRRRGLARSRPLRARERCRTPVPLPEVACYAVAADRDPLVPRSSALGEHGTHGLEFPESHRYVAPSCGHIDLLTDTSVWDRHELALEGGPNRSLRSVRASDVSMVMRPSTRGVDVSVFEVPHLHEEVRQRLTVRLGLGTSLSAASSDRPSRPWKVRSPWSRAREGGRARHRMMPSISASRQLGGHCRSLGERSDCGIDSGPS